MKTEEREAGDTDDLRYEAGHDYAPDARWGMERISVARGGAFTYRQSFREVVTGTVRGDIGAERASALFAALARSSFPSVPAHQLPPGGSMVRVSIGALHTGWVDRYFVAELDGFGDAIATLDELVGDARRAAASGPPV